MRVIRRHYQPTPARVVSQHAGGIRDGAVRRQGGRKACSQSGERSVSGRTDLDDDVVFRVGELEDAGEGGRTAHAMFSADYEGRGLTALHRAPASFDLIRSAYERP